MDGKIVFETEEGTETFYVLEQTKLNGNIYLLVADSEEEDGECLILKDISGEGDRDSVYVPVEDDTELEAVSRIFEELLEDVEIDS